MKLSIIVPVYGVEKYVRQCILSIIEQENNLFASVELIIINDGTKDKSIEQIQDLVDKYQNIKLINQDNQGLSMARNNGLEAATGDYVWFVDSDDWIASHAVATLLPYLDGKNDAIVMGAINVTDQISETVHVYFPEVKMMTGKDAYRNHCEQGYTSVLTVYRKAFLDNNHLRFLPGVFHEDNEFCPRVSYLSEKTTYIPDSLYYIRRAIADGRKSITTTANPKRAFDNIRVGLSVADFCSKYVMESDIKHILYNHISIDINNAFEIIVGCDSDQQQQYDNFYKENSSVLNECLSGGNVKYKIEALLFKLFPSNVTSVYKTLKKLI